LRIECSVIARSSSNFSGLILRCLLYSEGSSLANSFNKVFDAPYKFLLQIHFLTQHTFRFSFFSWLFRNLWSKNAPISSAHAWICARGIFSFTTQIHEYNVKTTEALARACDGFKCRGFKHLTPVNYPRVN
jgi:hypothetical protein